MFKMFASNKSKSAPVFGEVPEREDKDATIAELRGEVASTCALLTSARNDLDIARRQIAHRDSENAQLTSDIAGLLPDAEKYRAQKAKRMRNLRQFQSGAEAQGRG